MLKNSIFHYCLCDVRILKTIEPKTTWLFKMGFRMLITEKVKRNSFFGGGGVKVSSLYVLLMEGDRAKIIQWVKPAFYPQTTSCPFCSCVFPPFWRSVQVRQRLTSPVEVQFPRVHTATDMIILPVKFTQNIQIKYLKCWQIGSKPVEIIGRWRRAGES